jgi:ATP-dependent Clp protease adapter protein ClpS
MSQHHPDRSEFSSHPARPRLSRADAKPVKRSLPRYKIVLLRDGTLDMMFIIRTVMELIRFCRAEATHKMWESHYSGRSTLLTTYLERAELFAQQFAEKGLKVIIEAA